MVDYLKTRKVVVYEGQDDLNRNEAFEHLARHLGTHFDLLSEFYEKVKRCVATGRGQRIDIDGYSQASRSAAVQFGTLLHRHGMLKDFYYHRSPKKQLRVIPTKDGEIGQFLTGGWLEIYVFAVLDKRLRASMPEGNFQLLANVKGMLEDGREFEADLMAFVDGKFFWLECKTGNWQDYSARFRGLVKIFGVDRTSGGLLLIRPPDAATRARATDMLEMTLLSLADVDDFISIFLGEKPTGDSRRHEVHAATTAIPEEEIPLADAPPARKLGAVNLDGEEEPASSSGRRRRRRRGGRGRGRGRSSQAAAEGEQGASEVKGSGEAVEASSSRQERSSERTGERGSGRTSEGGSGRASERSVRGKLLEPLPIEKFEDSAEDGARETAKTSESAAKADTPSADAESDSSESGTRRRRRRRKSSPFSEEGTKAEASDDTKAEDSDKEPEVAAPKPRRRSAPKVLDLEKMVAAKPKAATPAKPKAATPAKAKPAPVEEVAEEEEVAVVEVTVVEETVEAVAVEKPKAVVAEAEPEVVEPESPGQKKTKSGVTIAPDLAAMMAGSKSKQD